MPTILIDADGCPVVDLTAFADADLPAGTVLGFRAMVAAAGADVASVSVVRRPRVVILGTGDELAEPGQALETPGSIPESVSFGVAALARQCGGEVIDRRRLTDTPETLEAAARLALSEADLIVVTGGASVGEKDYARSMFAPFGLELIFSKVAIKPGKPVWFGLPMRQTTSRARDARPLCVV